MAEDYLNEIRKVQPQGPYFLGGFSGGGITAYEMAYQLKQQGEEVALLVFLDTSVLPCQASLCRTECSTAPPTGENGSTICPASNAEEGCREAHAPQTDWSQSRCGEYGLPSDFRSEIVGEAFMAGGQALQTAHL